MISEKDLRDLLIGEKATTADYTQGSISVIDGYGSNGSRTPKFNMERALRKFNGWVYAAANANAKAAASCPLRLYIRNRTGKKCLWQTKGVSISRKKYILGDGDISPSNHVLRKSNQFGSDFLEVIDSHPVLDLLNNVNPWQNQFDLAYLRFLYLELTGNAYMQIAENRLGVPEFIYILPSQWVDIIPGKKGGPRLVDGYTYGVDSNDAVHFTPEEVIQFKYPNPNDLFFGLGKIESMWNIINVNDQLWNMRSAILKNNGRPDYAVIMKDLTNSNDSLQRYSRMLGGMLGGTSNAGKMVVIPGDVTFKELNFKPSDLGNDDETIIEMIAAGFGVPITKLKMNDANYSNATVGEVSWKTDTIKPMLIMDEQKLNEQLLPMFNVGDDAFLAYDNCVPSDVKLELEKTKLYMTQGIITANEVRETERLAPIEDGDIPLPALQYVLQDRFGLGSTGLGSNSPASEPIKSVEPVVVNNNLPAQVEQKQQELHVHVHNNITAVSDQEEVIEEPEPTEGHTEPSEEIEVKSLADKLADRMKSVE